MVKLFAGEGDIRPGRQIVGVALAQAQRGELGVTRTLAAGDFEVLAKLDGEIVVRLSDLQHLVVGEVLPRHRADIVDDGLVALGGAVAMFRLEGQGTDPVHCLPRTIVITLSSPTKVIVY